MTKITVITKNKHFYSIKCEGHTGYGVEGEDIVCAALSTIVQTALLGLLQVAGVNVKFQKNDAEGFLNYSLPDKMTDSESIKAYAIADTMLLGLNDLYEQFSDYIEMEVIDYVY